MQDGRVQVVDVDGILADVVAVVIGFAMGDSRLDTAARHPNGEAARMMIAAIVLGLQRTLAVNSSAKLSAPDNERIVEFRQLELIKLGQIVEHAPASRLAESRRVGEIQDRIPDGAELDALVLRGEKATAPETIVEGLVGRTTAPLRDHDDEGRQIL